MIVEGIYLNYGDICPLPKLLELKWKYKVRLFVDESLSFGVLGAHGRGVTEHFNVDVEDVDMICASLENAIASTGGFCCGRSFVIDHQRLSGLGYCFSASSPPLLASAAIESLNIMQSERERFSKLQNNSALFLDKLRKLNRFIVDGVEGSPVFHLRVRQPELHSFKPGVVLEKIVNMARERGVIVTKAACLEDQELFPADPSIRIAVSSDLSEEEIHKVIKVLEEISEQIF